MKSVVLRSLGILAVGVVCAVFAGNALAQRTIDFSANTTTGDGEVRPVLTWSTTPAAASCVASGQWEGEKGPEGIETLGPISSSATFNLTCTWPGDSLAELSWENPTQNCDGSPFTDHAQTIIRYAFNDAEAPVYRSASDGSVCGGEAITFEQITADCDNGTLKCVTGIEPTRTMHTVTQLSEIGDYYFAAAVCNGRNICSATSNAVSKTFTGAVTAVESVGIQVNPVPAPPVNISVR